MMPANSPRLGRDRREHGTLDTSDGSHHDARRFEREQVSVVYLEGDDNLASIREKLELADGGRVALVVPRYVRELRNPVRMKLLRRHARDIAKDVFVIAEDGEVRRQARREGFHVLGSIKALDKRLPVRFDAGGRPAAFGFDRPGVGLVVGLLVAAATLVFGLLVAAIIVPTASVELAPVTTPASEVIIVKASRLVRGVNVENLSLAARQIQATAEATDRTDATGKKTTADNRAKGRVTFSGTTADRTVVRRGTVVRTVGDVRFTTDDEVSVSGTNATATVAITAVDPGNTGNVGANQITGVVDTDLAGKLKVTNSAATTGGSQKETTFVTAADRNRLRQSIVEKLKAEGYAQLYAAKRPSESLYRENVSVTIVEEVFDRLLDEESKDVGIFARARVTAVAFEAKDVIDLGSRHANAQLPPNRQMLANSLQTAPLGITTWDDDSITFQLQVSYSMIPTIDEAQVRSSISGRGVDDAKTYLATSYNLARPPEISVWPPVLGVLPRLTARIDLRIIGS